jgi:hypothetical protein
VHLHRIDIGLVEQGLVGGWIIGLDRLDQLELAQDRNAFRRRQGLCGRRNGIVVVGDVLRRRGLGDPRREDGDTVGGFRRQ